MQHLGGLRAKADANRTTPHVRANRSPATARVQALRSVRRTSLIESPSRPPYYVMSLGTSRR